MSFDGRRVFKKIVSWAGVFFFLLAAFMLWWQLRHYTPLDILRALYHIPFVNLVYASIACFLGYLTLATYDYMALRYIGQSDKVKWWKWMLAGLLGFAISNNAGHAVVSGGAIRYRLYTRWRIRAADIVRMLTFSGFTYFLGATAIVVFGYFMVPHELFSGSVAGSIGIGGLFVFCCAALGAYFAMTIFFKGKNIKLGDFAMRIPTTGTAAVQTFVGICDSVLAGMVLYFVLIPTVHIDFTVFIGLFVIAQTAGVFSQVPGGIGVFESVFMFAVPDDVSRASVFGALLAYRVIYYVLPLIGMGGLFWLYEHNLRQKIKGWMEEAKQKAADTAHNIGDKVKKHVVKK